MTVAFQENVGHSFKANLGRSRNVTVEVTPAEVICFAGGFGDQYYDWRMLTAWNETTPFTPAEVQHWYDEAKFRFERDSQALDAVVDAFRISHGVVPRMFYFHYPLMWTTASVGGGTYLQPVNEYAPLGFKYAADPWTEFLEGERNIPLTAFHPAIEIVYRPVFWDVESPGYWGSFFDPIIDRIGRRADARLGYPVITTGPWNSSNRDYFGVNHTLTLAGGLQLAPGWDWPGHPWLPLNSAHNAVIDYLVELYDVTWGNAAVEDLAGTAEPESAIQQGHVRVSGSTQFPLQYGQVRLDGASINAVLDAASRALNHLNQYH